MSTSLGECFIPAEQCAAHIISLQQKRTDSHVAVRLQPLHRRVRTVDVVCWELFRSKFKGRFLLSWLGTVSINMMAAGSRQRFAL